MNKKIQNILIMIKNILINKQEIYEKRKNN